MNRCWDRDVATFPDDIPACQDLLERLILRILAPRNVIMSHQYPGSASVRICEEWPRVVVPIAERPYWAYPLFSHVKTADWGRHLLLRTTEKANQEGFIRSIISFVEVVLALNAVAHGNVSAVVSFRRRM